MGLGAPSHTLAAESSKKPGQKKEVGAVEDLMREHGVLRRALLVYIETVPRLRGAPGKNLPLEPIARTAKLFRSFGEDYHERKLEEAHIFPVVKRPAARRRVMSMCSKPSMIEAAKSPTIS